jgi:hypothetical protein
MNTKILKEIVNLANKNGFTFIATSNKSGLPHVAAARKLEIADEGKLSVKEWFCPGTVENLNENPQLSVVVWDNLKDTGFQVLGISEGIKDIAYLDGYSPELDVKHSVPVVEREISIKVNTILEFKQAPHTDKEEY